MRNLAPFDFSPLKINHCKYCFWCVNKRVFKSKNEMTTSFYFQLFQLIGSVRIRAYIVSTNLNSDKYQMSLLYKNYSRLLQSHNQLKMFGSMLNLQGVQNLSVNMWRIDILNFCSSEAELTKLLVKRNRKHGSLDHTDDD